MDRIQEILSLLGKIEIEKAILDQKKSELMAEYEQLNQVKVLVPKKPSKPQKINFPERLKRRENEAEELIEILKSYNYRVKKPRIATDVMCWELNPVDDSTVRWGLYLTLSGWSMDKINTQDPDEWANYFILDVYDLASTNCLELAE